MADPRLRADPQERFGSSRPAPPKRRSGSAGPRAPKPRRRRRLLAGLGRFALLVGLWCVILGGLTLAYFAVTLPDTSQLAVAERRPSVTIEAEDGSTIATFGDLFGQPLTLKQMS